MTNSTLPDASHAAIDGAASPPLLERFAHRASAFAERGIDATLASTDALRRQARHASDSSVGYIRDEPVKSVLFAAAAGAALMVLFNLATRSRTDR